MIAGMRQQLGIEEQQIMLLSLSRISYEKIFKQLFKGYHKLLKITTNSFSNSWKWSLSRGFKRISRRTRSQ